MDARSSWMRPEEGELQSRALYRFPLYPWGRGRGEFKTVFKGFLKAKMGIYKAHKTLRAIRVIS